MLTFDEQLERERAADEEAAADTLKEYAEAFLSGNISELPRTKIILGRLFASVKENIELVQATPFRGHSSAIRHWLKELDPSVAAVLALRIVINSVHKASVVAPCTFQTVASAIGDAYQTEVMTNKAYKVNPMYVDRALANLKANTTSSENHIRRTMKAVYTNVLQLNDEQGLSRADLMKFGKYGLQACMDADLVILQRGTNHKGKLATYALHPDIAEFLHPQSQDVMLVTQTSALSMLAPPLDWTAPGVGGYYSTRRQVVYPLRHTSKGSLRRSIRKEYRAALAPENMPVVYEVANYLQSQAFEVKDDVYDLVMKLWQEGGGVLGVPKPSIGERPECPLPKTWDKATGTDAEREVFTAWKRSVVRYYSDQIKNTTHVRECTTLLRTARELRGREVYHPVHLDFRGRLYYRGTPNPQGTDLSRAVLHFHNKKPLGRRGVYWLKVHIANSLGFDSVSFDERVAYVDSIWNLLQADLSYPTDSELYRGAEAPFCALSAVIELSKAIASGNPETYCTGLVVHMDATCSGLQHFSAMLRDEVGGSYVNLIDVGKKADIYTRVAEIVTGRVQEDAKGGSNELYARLWETIPIERKLAKKPVMTYVYGATQHGTADWVYDYLTDIGYKNEAVSNQKLATYMAGLLFPAIENVVPKAAAAMRWLKSLVKQCPKDTPIQWTTPLGFPVNHDYRNIEETRIKVQSCGLMFVVAYNELDSCNIKRMQNAISPNFVHSLDATHLMLTAKAMTDQGLNMVTIHDSFGTHPSDVDILLRETKEAFVRLYTDNDIFQDLIKDLGLDIEIPSSGNLDLNLVNKSPFFFT